MNFFCVRCLIFKWFRIFFSFFVNLIAIILTIWKIYYTDKCCNYDFNYILVYCNMKIRMNKVYGEKNFKFMYVNIRIDVMIGILIDWIKNIYLFISVWSCWTSTLFFSRIINMQFHKQQKDVQRFYMHVLCALHN